MSTAWLVVAMPVLVVCAAAGIHAAQLFRTRRVVDAAQRHRERVEAELAANARAERETERIRRDPLGFIRRARLQLEPELIPLRATVTAARRDLDTAKVSLEGMPAPDHKGVGLAARLVMVGALIGVALVGAGLNVEIFVAVNGGLSDPAAIGKGVGASLVELLLTLAVADLANLDRLRTLTGKILLLGAGSLLLAVVALVASYAPARSERTFATPIDNATRVVEIAKASDQKKSTPKTKAALAAAQSRHDDLVQQLDRGRASDTAQAMTFPAAEALAGPFALDGLAAVALLLLREHRRRRVRDAVSAVDRAQIAHDIPLAQTEVVVATRLAAADIVELPSAPRELPAAPLVPPAMPTEPLAPIDLRDFPPDSATPPLRDPVAPAPSRAHGPSRWDL